MDAAPSLNGAIEAINYIRSVFLFLVLVFISTEVRSRQVSGQFFPSPLVLELRRLIFITHRRNLTNILNSTLFIHTVPPVYINKLCLDACLERRIKTVGSE